MPVSTAAASPRHPPLMDRKIRDTLLCFRVPMQIMANLQWFILLFYSNNNNLAPGIITLEKLFTHTQHTHLFHQAVQFW